MYEEITLATFDTPGLADGCVHAVINGLRICYPGYGEDSFEGRVKRVDNSVVFIGREGATHAVVRALTHAYVARDLFSATERAES